MTRSRLFLSLGLIAILATLGYMGYQRYLAPVPETPTSAVTEANADATNLITTVSAEGKIIPAKDATLAFRLAGRVAAVKVKTGDTVSAGTVLIQLEDADLRAAVEQARAAVAVAQAQLDQLVSGARLEEIAAAEARYKAAQSAVGQAAAQRDQVKKGATADTLAAAQAQLAQAEARQKEAQIAYDQVLENIKFLAGPTEEKARFNLNAMNESVIAAQKAIEQLKAGASEETVRAYNNAVGIAAFQRDAAKAQLDLLKAGASLEQVAIARAQLTQTQATLSAAQAQLAQATLKAPFAGTVMRVDLEVGEMAPPNAPVVVMADITHWRLQTSDLSETDVVLVHPGQTATITLDAFAKLTFIGQVTEIASLAETNRGNVTYAVTIELDPTEAALRWGMTAFVDIKVSE